jgi:hypothetical protein
VCSLNGNCVLLCDGHPFCTSVDVADAGSDGCQHGWSLCQGLLPACLGAGGPMRMVSCCYNRIQTCQEGRQAALCRVSCSCRTVHRWQWQQQLDCACASSYSWSKQGTLPIRLLHVFCHD